MSIRQTYSRTCHPALIVLLVVGSLLHSVSTLANDFREGLDAYLDGDYETALALWGPLGKGGNAAAQHGLGTLYHAGKGVPQDYQKATRWFRLAAEQDHAAAQFSLGNAYRQGQGVPRDDRLAGHWWGKAAEKDFVPAKQSLGNLHRSGRGVVRDDKRAIRGYRPGAANGSRTAQQLVDARPQSPSPPVSTSRRMNTPVAALRPITKRAPHKGTEVKKEAWLLQQAPDHYALQLTAGRNEENIKAFISRHDLSEEAAYFRTLKNGDEWYSLIYGSYSDYDQARRALEALPEQLRNNSPWVRTLSSVQTSIVKFGGNHSE